MIFRTFASRTVRIALTVAAILWLVKGSQPLPIMNIGMEQYSAAAAEWGSVNTERHEETGHFEGAYTEFAMQRTKGKGSKKREAVFSR